VRWCWLLLVASCAGAPDTCPAMSGAYRVVTTRLSGDCAEVPEQILQTESGVDAQFAECARALWVVSANRCRLDFDVICPGDGFTLRATGVTYYGDGHAANAMAEMTFSGRIHCSSVYSVSYTRI
jgi:hypothetical protein